jgi:hypothetical protein
MLHRPLTACAWALFGSLCGCECGDPPEDSDVPPGESGPTDESGGDSDSAETGGDTDSSGDSHPDSPLDTVETGPPELQGRVFECGGWETQPAPQGPTLLRDASVSLLYESQRVVNAGLAADIDGDGCSELALATYPDSDHGTGVLFLPGTVAETVIIEQRQRAILYGAEYHYADIISIGDLDADGQTDDWVIGASSSTMVKDGFTGAVYVFSEPLAGDYMEADASMTLWPPEESQSFSEAIDVNDLSGDGVDDLAVGWSYSTQRKRILVFKGPLSSGLTDSEAAASIETEDGGSFGYHLSAEGDLNADGVADLVPTAFSSDGYAGAVYVFHGPVSGSMVPEDADRVLQGEQSLASTGFGISGGADANRDGYDDLLIPADGAGKVYLVLGPVEEADTLADAHAVFTGGGYLGFDDALSLPQDLDADGYPDPVIGDLDWHAYGNDPRGAHFLFYGPVSGTHDVADADAIFYEDDEEWEYGSPGGFVTGVGDTDGDGYDDLLMGTWGTGPAWLFRGGPR